MFLFEVNSKRYGICQTAEDISIKRFTQLMELEEKKMPDCLRKLQQLNLEQYKLEKDKEEDHSARLMELEAEIQAAQDDLFSEENEPAVIDWQIHLAVTLSNCPMAIWQRMDKNGFYTLLNPAFAALKQVYTYQPKAIKSIYWKEQDWYLPAEKLADVTMGRLLQAKEFEKQAKQLRSGYYNAILNMLPVLLLKKDEQYSYNLYAERAGIFQDLPVNDAMDVAFFLTSKINSSNLSTHIYSIAGILSKLKRSGKR